MNKNETKLIPPKLCDKGFFLNTWRRLNIFIKSSAFLISYLTCVTWQMCKAYNCENIQLWQMSCSIFSKVCYSHSISAMILTAENMKWIACVETQLNPIPVKSNHIINHAVEFYFLSFFISIYKNESQCIHIINVCKCFVVSCGKVWTCMW